MTKAGSSGNGDGMSDALGQQARDWLRMLASGEVKPGDADAFKRWLESSPAHARAFLDARQRWEALGPGLGEMLRLNPAAAAFHRQTMRGQHLVSRRAFLGVAVGTAAAAGVVAFHPAGRLLLSPQEWNADLRTATGEQRSVRLAERVSIILNTQTSVRRRVESGDMVGMDLLSGEAAIDVAAGEKPFAVTAGVGRSLSAGGRFDVRYLAARACVTCIEGRVRIEHPAGDRTLYPGQRLVYGERDFGGPEPVDAAAASAWRKGELVFDNTPLADVIEEINRYREGRIVLANEAVRNSPVSGRFVIKALDAALAQLQDTFELRATTLPGGWLVLR